MSPIHRRLVLQSFSGAALASLLRPLLFYFLPSSLVYVFCKLLFAPNFLFLRSSNVALELIKARCGSPQRCTDPMTLPRCPIQFRLRAVTPRSAAG